jgi:HAD superfamily hydrolase (TIGR01509 family)
MKIKGIIFDFDGLICDTETPEVRAWEALFSEFGLTFPFDRYQETIGAIHNDDSPFVFLEEMLDHPVDRCEVKEGFLHYRNKLIAAEPMRPGIFGYLNESRKEGLHIGLASSSPRSWIDHHLSRFRLLDFFSCIKTCNDVSNTKPDPELYIKSLECMQLQGHEVIALEDSPNGVSAAKKAGIYVAVFPNEVTRIFKFINADLVINNLEEMPLKEMLGYFYNL